MPKSRPRRSRQHARRAPSRAPGAPRSREPRTNPISRADLDALVSRYDEESWATVEAGADAEARGDAARALELHLGGPHVPGSLREHLLRELVWLGSEAPSWVPSRWILKQAYRWL